jgi:hypothetical protein
MPVVSAAIWIGDNCQAHAGSEWALSRLRYIARLLRSLEVMKETIIIPSTVAFTDDNHRRERFAEKPGIKLTGHSTP